MKRIHRWMLIATMALLGAIQAGCYCTEWRWIWEDDDVDCHCQKVQIISQPAAGGGAVMSVSVPDSH